MAIEDTSQYKIVKITLAEQLIEELQQNFNNIARFEDIIRPTIQSSHHIVSNLRISENFQTNMDNFIENLNNYIPNLANRPDGTNPFLESIQSIMTNTFDYYPEGSNIFNMLGATTLEDIQNLTELDSAFSESITNNLFAGTFQNILTDFDLDEFRLGSIFSVVEHNLGLFDIQNSLANIADISENLITNFADVANLEFVQGLLSNLPQTMSSLFLDKFGNFSISGILESFGIPDVAGILDNVLNVSGVMNSVIGQITGQLSSFLGGGGMCGCVIGIGLGNFGGFLGNISGSLGQISGVITGTLNSTVNNILNGTSIGEFLDVEQITDNITNQIADIRNPDLNWSDLENAIYTEL